MRKKQTLSRANFHVLLHHIGTCYKETDSRFGLSGVQSMGRGCPRTPVSNLTFFLHTKKAWNFVCGKEKQYTI